MKKTFLYLLTLMFILFNMEGYTQNVNEVKRLPAAAFKKALDSTNARQVVDVRTPEEFAEGHIAEATNLNIYERDFIARINLLDRSKPVFVYCKAGARSADAATQMKKMGFTNIYDLQGGIMSWEHNNLPVEKTTEEKPQDVFTIAQFDSLLANNKNLMIDFYAPWCMPCREMEPSLKRLTKQYQGKITLYRINVDEAKSLTQMLRIDGIPVVTTYKNGTEINRAVGFQSAASLRTLANELLKSK